MGGGRRSPSPADLVGTPAACARAPSTSTAGAETGRRLEQRPSPEDSHQGSVTLGDGHARRCHCHWFTKPKVLALAAAPHGRHADPPSPSVRTVSPQTPRTSVSLCAKRARGSSRATGLPGGRAIEGVSATLRLTLQGRPGPGQTRLLRALPTDHSLHAKSMAAQDLCSRGRWPC